MLSQDIERMYQIRQELERLAAKDPSNLTSGEIYTDNRLSGRLMTEAFEILATESNTGTNRAILLAGRKIFS